EGLRMKLQTSIQAKRVLWILTVLLFWLESVQGPATVLAGSPSPGSCVADSWTATSLKGAPSGRSGHSAVWTGSEMIVWGGWRDSYFNTGGRYNPVSDTWAPVSLEGAPSPRDSHTAIW